MNKIAVFDFDGTVANSLGIVYDTIIRNYSNLGYKKCSPKTAALLLKEGAQTLITELDIDKSQIPNLMNDIRSNLATNIDNTEPFPQIINILKQIVKKNYTLGILTSNNKKTVKHFLSKHDIDSDFVYDKADLEGKSKLLAQMIQEQDISQNNVCYIGDEDRDIIAAKENNIISIAVAWGLNSKEYLEKLNPDYLAEKPKDLLKILKV